MKYLKIFYGSIAAGVMVGVGGTAYLSTADKNVGALLFSIGLLTICTYGFRLYTGSIGYLITDTKTPWRENVITAIVIWLGNYVGTTVYGSILRMAKPELAAKAAEVCEIKLAQGLQYNLMMGIMCGVLMYLAVDIYKRKTGVERYLGIFFAVPVFIMSGFEHSIADMLYLALAYGRLLPTAQTISFLLVVTLGNSVGSVFLPVFIRATAQVND